MSRFVPDRRLTTVLVAVAAASAAVIHASRHVSTGPASGAGFHRPTSCDDSIGDIGANRPRAVLRLATFNIHSGKGTDQRRDLSRTAALLAGIQRRDAASGPGRPLDLIGLNEVRGPQWFFDADQTRWLGETLRLHYLAAPTTRTWYHCTSGNAVLSRRDARSWQRIPLPRQYDRSQRNCVLVALPHDDSDVRVVVTHLTRGDGRDRRKQLRAVVRLFLAIEEPAVLLGDLNATADDPLLAALLERPDVVDPVGHALGDSAPAERIDWIIARGMEPVRAGVVETKVSDHPLVWAELRASRRETTAGLPTASVRTTQE